MKANQEQVESFLKDLSYKTRYTFLEVGKDDKELQEIAERRGIVLPSPDLSIFKARYALIDKANKNDCILEKSDVEESLDTLIGKRVDIDHLTRKVVGYWIDAKIDGNEIVGYGAIFKSSFEEEMADVKKLMSDGQAGISFEAWGEREFHNDQTYSLKKIHFAGGGLLLTTEPAEPTAQILELAKVMTPPDRFFHVGTDDKKVETAKEEKSEIRAGLMQHINSLEIARWYLWDIETVARLISEAKKPGTDEPLNAYDVCSIDFENNKAVCKAMVQSKGKEPYECKYEIELSPRAKMLETSKSARSILGVKEVETKTENSQEQKPVEAKKEDVKVEAVQSCTKCSEVQTKLDEATKQVETQKTELASLQEKVAQFEKAETDSKVASRRTELGEEIAKDMKDEDILNDSEFEKAKLKKEIADLNQKLVDAGKKTPEKASAPKTLDTGSKSKTAGDTVFAAQKRVSEYAFNENSEQE